MKYTECFYPFFTTDGTKVTTTNINGPNFMIHEESAIQTSKDNKGKAGNKLNLASSFSPFLLKGFPLENLFGGLGPVSFDVFVRNV